MDLEKTENNKRLLTCRRFLRLFPVELDSEKQPNVTDPHATVFSTSGFFVLKKLVPFRSWKNKAELSVWFPIAFVSVHHDLEEIQ